MIEFMLKRPELLAILDAIQIENVVGIARDTLFPSDVQQRRSVVATGMAMLEQQHFLIQRQGNKPILDRDLFAAISVMAFPDLAIMIIRNTANFGAQLFLEYLSANLVIEQTFPLEGIHRLAFLDGIAGLRQRIQDIVELPAAHTEPVQPPITLAQQTFVLIQRLINEHRWGDATTILRQGLPSGIGSGQFLDAVQNPLWWGNIALLRCRHEEIVDARNIAILRGSQSAWQITQQTPGEAVLVVKNTTQNQLEDTLLMWLDELSTGR